MRLTSHRRREISFLLSSTKQCPISLLTYAGGTDHSRPISPLSATVNRCRTTAILLQRVTMLQHSHARSLAPKYCGTQWLSAQATHMKQFRLAPPRAHPHTLCNTNANTYDALHPRVICQYLNAISMKQAELLHQLTYISSSQPSQVDRSDMKTLNV